MKIHVHLSAQLKLSAKFEQKENKAFCDQFWKKFWKECFDFYEIFIWLTLLLFFYCFFLTNTQF